MQRKSAIQENREEYPIIEREIEIDKAEVRRIRTVLSYYEPLSRILASVLEEVLEKAITQQDEEWDALAGRFGFEDGLSLHESGRSVTVDYLRRRLVLRRKEESDKE